MQRLSEQEWLDLDEGTPQEVAESLADLRRINQVFGGVRTTVCMAAQVARRLALSKLALLDIAAGSGDGALAVQQNLARRGIQVDITLLDRRTSHFLPPHSGIRHIAGDALALPFPDASFDLVTCSLFAHHLDPDELIAFVDEALRVCRFALLINDLRRSAFSLALTYAGLPLFRSPLTRHDAVASVRKAYTILEMRTLLGCSRGADIQIEGHYLFRMGAIVWKINPHTI